MCLSQVLEVNRNNAIYDEFNVLEKQPRIKRGYKVYLLEKDYRGRNVYCGANDFKVLTTDKSLKYSSSNSDGYIFADDNTAYKVGFHILTSLKDARTVLKVKQRRFWNKYVLLQVEFDEVTTIGIEDQFNDKSMKCVVANKMRIIKQIKEKKKVKNV